LTDPDVPRGELPAWEIMLSHHLPPRFGRTVALRLRTRTIHFCARCSGQVVGLLGFMTLFGVSLWQPLPLFTPSTQLLFALGPLAAAADWVTQTLGHRESTNSVRVLSGALLGFSVTDVTALILSERWELFAGAVLVFAVYLSAIFILLKVTGAWRKVLEEHFPGFDSDTAL
jgi:uncharacterized membrane protein